MHRELALRLLGDVMRWDDERAHTEFQWIRLMSRMKYDSYGDYQAGLRFAESLANWLQQFAMEDREVAYSLLRDRLIFVSHGELRRLVEAFYPAVVEEGLVKSAAAQMGIAPYLVWSNAEAREVLARLMRATLYVGLSDGARVDLLRRANVGRISNEQVVVGVQVDEEKWLDLGASLRDDLPESRGVFSRVYLVDDFAASGSTLLRRDPETGAWKGKLVKLYANLSRIQTGPQSPPISEDTEVHVHHYIATDLALEGCRRRDQEIRTERGDDWFKAVQFSSGMVLGGDVRITEEAVTGLARRYYDHGALYNRHARQGGTTDVALGFANCGLPVVLHHNTPNNSIPLLWAETSGEGGAHPMRPLFRRRSRHA